MDGRTNSAAARAFVSEGNRLFGRQSKEEDETLSVCIYDTYPAPNAQ
jgi:hypothetical protein